MNERILRYSKIYLCGQIENDSFASHWRVDLKMSLLDIEPTLRVWDPMIKPDWMSADARSDEVAFNKTDLYGPLSDRSREEYLDGGLRSWNAAQEIRKVCKKLASSCDFMIARITKTFTWGSIDELEIASSINKPVFFWFPEGPVSTYGIPGCITQYDLMNEYCHADVGSLLSAIRALNEGRSDLLNKDAFAWTYLTY